MIKTTAGEVIGERPTAPDMEWRAQEAHPPDILGRATYKIEEAARILGIGRNSAYAAARDGTLRTVRIGNRILVPRQALERLLAGE